MVANKQTQRAKNGQTIEKVCSASPKNEPSLQAWRMLGKDSEQIPYSPNHGIFFPANLKQWFPGFPQMTENYFLRKCPKSISKDSGDLK